jgi:hypothetical protein
MNKFNKTFYLNENMYRPEKQYIENNGDIDYTTLLSTRKECKLPFFKTTFKNIKEIEKKIKELNSLLRKQEKLHRDAKHDSLIKQYEKGTLKPKPKKQKSFQPFIASHKWDDTTNTLYYSIETINSYN